MTAARVVVIGAGIGGLTTAALLAKRGLDVTVLEAQAYAGGSAGTFFHKGYRFDAGATVAGGFQAGGPHALLADQLGLEWPVRPHEPAWVVHLPDAELALTQDNHAILARFPESAAFWRDQAVLADAGWRLSGAGLPWPPQTPAELQRLMRIGLTHIPQAARLAPFALTRTRDWLRARGLAGNREFVRFIDAQLLISAQTTSQHANGAYAATALDLGREGVMHVRGGMGGLADTLVRAIHDFGGRVIFRQRAAEIRQDGGRAAAVRTTRGEAFPADVVIANLTPATLDRLLGVPDVPIDGPPDGYGAFVLHVGVDAAKLPVGMADHHQFVDSVDGPMGEGHTIFLSMSPAWDETRAPAGRRAVTLTTHTRVGPWLQAHAAGDAVYEARKADYTERLLEGVERMLPGFRAAVELVLAGSPTTYEFYTGRRWGLVGGFPQTSLLHAKGPRTSLPNVLLVGDSIFPGQSTAGVTLGAMRVAERALRTAAVSAVRPLAVESA